MTTKSEKEANEEKGSTKDGTKASHLSHGHEVHISKTPNLDNPATKGRFPVASSGQEPDNSTYRTNPVDRAAPTISEATKAEMEAGKKAVQSIEKLTSQYQSDMAKKERLAAEGADKGKEDK